MIKYPVAEPDIGLEEEKYVLDCLRSNWISSLGKYITDFENQMAQRFQTQHAVATSNGTTSLHLALIALNVGDGDEVIIPSLTFAACANAVCYVGAKPVLADSNYGDWNMDPSDIEKKITRKTKAIMVVHLYGHPAQMGPIMSLAKKHNLKVIEDCAEAHGAQYENRPVGSFGDIASFSFYGNKIMTTGEGGMLLLNDSNLAAKIRLLRDHHMDPLRRYFHTAVGYNYRMTNIQAAIGLAQLEKLDRFLNKKREIALQYNQHLTSLGVFDFMPSQPWAKPVCWLYSVLLSKQFEKKISRDAFCAALKSAGIDNRPFFIPMHALPYLPVTRGSFTVATDLSQRGLNLPSSTKLTVNDVKEICNVISDIVNQSN